MSAVSKFGMLVPKPSDNSQVHVIFDDSGSMYHSGTSDKSFMKVTRKEFDLMADRLESTNLSFIFHLFSDTVCTGRRLGDMPRLSLGTNIALGFEAMVESIKTSPCKHSIVIFVSDGADVRGNEARRARLPPLPCKSTLLTVAVGDGFPTSLVVNELRVKYHTFGGDSIPLVFPLSNEDGPEMISNVQWVVSQLEEIIKAGGVQPEFSVEELASRVETTKDIGIIFLQCKRWYNACTIKCMSPQPQLSLLEKIEMVKETKDKLNKAEELMKNATADLSKPLPSNLRARRPLFLLTSLREKLNVLMEQLKKGRLFDELSDVEKKEYLSFGNTAGRFLATSMKYNAANFETTKASLLRFVKNYSPTKADENLVDQINLCSWAEYMEDARDNAELLDLNDMRTLAGVLEGFPFIGRTVELNTIPECAQINPWVVSIKKMPMTIKTVTTHDLYIRYHGEMDVRGEIVNSVIICGGDPTCPGIFCHLQSFALSKNWLLYFNDARLAAASMLVVYVLCSGDSGEWKLEELSYVRSICTLHTPVNSKWWHNYLDCLKTDDFRDCLVTESPKLDKCMTCPGIGKFILGMWWLADQGHIFTDLPNRFQAAAVELLGRCKVNADDFFAVKCTFKGSNFNPAIEALETVKPALKASHLSMRKISNLLQSALEVHIKKGISDVRKETTVAFKADELMKVAHFNLSLKHIKCFFEGLIEKQDGCKWTGPADGALMRTLMIATSHDTSFDRNHPTFYADATCDSILNSMADKMAGKSCADTRKNIMMAATQEVSSYFNFRHMGLPRPIPYELVVRYKEETGRDIAETWQLDHETSLSPIACCFPACDLYLVIPLGGEQKQRQVIRDHLRICCRNSIPGLHRCVVRNINLPVTEIIKRVESGTELGEPFLPREVTRRLAKGVGVCGGVPRSFASAEQYKEHALEIEYKSVARKMKAAIKEFTGGDSVVLYHAIDDIKISFDAKMWSYSEFKRTFDAKYEAMEESVKDSRT